MLGKYSLVAPARMAAAAAAIAALSAGVTASAAAAPVGTFQKRASTQNPVNNVVVDPTTKLLYAQQFEGKHLYRYNPRTNKWKTLRSAPLEQENNGGGAYLKGKLYMAYSENDTQMGVYDIATGKWSTIANPLGAGTGDITAAGGLLYLAEGTNFVSYNPATHTTTTLAPPPFSFSSWGGLAPYQGDIYGQEGDGDSPEGFAVYDVATNTWTTLPDVPPDGAVLGAAVDPVTGTFYAYGGYGEPHFYRYKIAAGKWLSNLTFPNHDLNDGGMAYVSIPKLQGIYATWGQDNTGFSRYVTPRHRH